MSLKNKSSAKLLLGILLLAALALPTHFVFAFDVFGTLTGMTMGVAISGIVYIIFTVLAYITSALIQLFSWLVYIRLDASLPVITQTWTIFRDLANMLFIVILVWMAFGTIFQLKNYTFSDMIMRLIIAAVLINFSLAIAGVVLDATQVLTNVFLSAIGNPAVRLGQYLQPGQFFQSNLTSSFSGLDILSAAGISLVFYIILEAMFLFGILVATVFALIRIFVVWGLLMVSPLYWMAYILPGTRKRFTQWWNWFLGWTLFLPIYLFMLYIGLFFLSQKDAIIAGITQNVANPNGTFGASGLTLNLVVFYAFATFILSFSAWAAIRITRNWGSGFAWGVNSSRNFINKYVPGFNTYQAAQKAGIQRGKDFMSGPSKLPAWTGMNRTKQEAFFNRKFGVKGAGQKDFAKNVKDRYEDLEEQYNSGKLTITDLRNRVANARANSPEGYAYLKLAAKKGAWDSDDRFRNVLSSLKNNPYAVNDLIKTAKESKFKGIKKLNSIALDESLKSPSMIAAKREMLAHIAEDGRGAAGLGVGADGAADIEKAMTAMGGKDAPEFQDFIRNLGKLRPDLTIPYLVANPLDPSKPSTPEASWDKALAADAKDVAKWDKKVWEDTDFQSALQRKLTVVGDPRARQKLKDRLLQLTLSDTESAAKQDIIRNIAP